ncbi:MAG: thrombospondin type-1 domain-containing protein, partial [Candidatus Paceibacterota bacterium]
GNCLAPFKCGSDKKCENVQSVNVDCVMSAYENLPNSFCSQDCGGGTLIKRQRRIITPASGTGVPCGPLTEEEPCNTHPCPIYLKLGNIDFPASTYMGSPIQNKGTKDIEELKRLCTRDVNCSGFNSNGWMVDKNTTRAHVQGGITAYRKVRPNFVDYIELDNIDYTTSVAGGGQNLDTVNQATFQVLKEKCDKNINCDGFALTSSGIGTLKKLNNENPVVAQGSKFYLRLHAPGSNIPQPVTTSPVTAPAVQPVDCVMSEWAVTNPCDKVCGGGVLTKRRTITKPASGNGKACGPIEEKISCNTHACQIDDIDITSLYNLNNRKQAAVNLQPLLGISSTDARNIVDSIYDLPRYVTNETIQLDKRNYRDEAIRIVHERIGVNETQAAKFVDTILLRYADITFCRPYIQVKCPYPTGKDFTCQDYWTCFDKLLPKTYAHCGDSNSYNICGVATDNGASDKANLKALS